MRRGAARGKGCSAEAAPQHGPRRGVEHKTEVGVHSLDFADLACSDERSRLAHGGEEPSPHALPREAVGGRAGQREWLSRAVGAGGEDRRG